MDAAKSKLLWLVELLILTAICGIYRYFGIPAKSLPTVFTIYLVVAVPMLWSWRNAKTELIKRCILAVPFVISLIIIGKLFGFGTLFSVYIGMLLLLCLLIKTDNWKLHLIITFTTSLVLTFLNVYLGYGAPTQYKPFIISAVAIPIGTFYLAYLSAIVSKEPVKFRRLFANSIKFAIALLSMLYLLVLSWQLCRHYNISFAISFGISALIALGFLGFCRLFNIKHPAASDIQESNLKKTKRTNECECCGKAGLPQELLFKIDSGQRVCADCLKNMG
jgi:hypothetical protein